MKKISGTILFLLCFGIIGYAAAPSTSFKAAVDSGNKEWSAAIAAKDSARVGALYAQDAIAFPPNSDMVQGRAAIQAFWKGFIDANMKASIETVSVESDGNLGAEVGKYTIMDASGKTVDSGKYVVVWKKTAEGWKLYRDIWNTNSPAPAAAK
jgi:uncharacterized protein (TIGR02246 family)